MTMHLRSLPTGARFVLCRTGDRYTLFRRDRDRWGGTVIVVLRDGAANESSLHHACHVKPIIRAANRDATLPSFCQEAV